MVGFHSLIGRIRGGHADAPRRRSLAAPDVRGGAGPFAAAQAAVFESLERRTLMNDMIQFGLDLGAGDSAYLPEAGGTDLSARFQTVLDDAAPLGRADGGAAGWSSSGIRPLPPTAPPLHFAAQQSTRAAGVGGRGTAQPNLVAEGDPSSQRRTIEDSQATRARQSPVGQSPARRPAGIPGPNHPNAPKPAKPAKPTLPGAPTDSVATATAGPTKPAGPTYLDPRDTVPTATPISGPLDSAPVRGPVLTPGTGFTGPTPQPPAVGAGPGIDAKAIARWDVVPYQTFTNTFQAGVVAFHMNGIERVEFSLNGGNWTAVRAMSRNPTTDVYEYWVTLDAKTLPDGPVEVRAVAYPTVGEPRVLEPLMLNANAGGSLPSPARYVSPSGNDTNGDGSSGNPFATMARAAAAIASTAGRADGGLIYLLPGDHITGTSVSPRPTANRWLTITPAPGVAKQDVRIVDMKGDGLRTKLVHLRGVTITPLDIAPVLSSNGPLEDYLWLDDVHIVGLGRTVDSSITSKFTESYVTDSSITATRNGFSASLVRASLVQNIGSDAFQNAGMVINSVADGIDNRDTTYHADVLQFNGEVFNRIVYGLQTRGAIRAQGMFADGATSLKDVAIVNTYVNNRDYDNPDSRRVFQFGSVTDHFYITNSTFVGTAVWRVDLGFTAYNVVVEDTTFTPGPVPSPSDVAGVTYR